MTTVFREAYGNTIRNRILEYLLENEGLDFAVSDMARELNISKPKAYEIIRKFEEKDFVKKSRIIGKTQLYLLNKENRWVKIYIRNFKEALKIFVEEYEKKHDYKTNSRQLAIAEKKTKYKKKNN